ncbi:gamma-glutamyltransferase [Pseudomonas sp. F1_0610]|uniref:gamma-glutamyltransferase n=1 Tax=Pseudomonas sp. F1_0610 TaxID=3114284 RepID=UPI0039C259DA
MHFTRTFIVSSLLVALLAAPTVQAKQPPELSAAAQAAARYDYALDVFHPVHASTGMVASEQALATQVGVDILKQGGNAIDAAVATGFALAVVLPNAGNIGGGGFMLRYDSETATSTALDFRETAPKKASRNMYLDEQGNVIQGKSMFSHQAVGVPGTVAGLEYALEHWGTMSLEQVLQPSIELAEKGFIVSETLGKMLNAEADNLKQWDSTKAIFFKGEQPLKAGDLLVQKDLAKSLRLIAKEGSSAFYEGDIAKAIVAEMEKHHGMITLADLAAYKAVEREPVMGDYRGYQVISMPPPSSGGVHLIQILNILSHFPMSEYGANSAESIRLIAEASKYAYADRAEYLGDPDFVKVPVQGLTAKAYAQQIAKGIKPNSIKPASQIKAGKPQPYESDQTTHYSVVDKQGNMVGVTYTLNLNFGSGIVASGTGILLNNEMDDFSVKPGVANAFGLIGGEANAIEAGKRPLSSMMPTLVLKDGKPWMVTGSPGGARIITTVLQTIVNSIDYGMNPAEAAASLRIHHQWQPDELRVEKGLSPDTLKILRNLGYNIQVKAAMGRTQSIQVTEDGLLGYSDPRNPDGGTLGY